MLARAARVENRRVFDVYITRGPTEFCRKIRRNLSAARQFILMTEE